MSEYKIKANPTTYKGIKFRSRLEATWAAFFDGLGWRWDYEPVDLHGWVPDFIIRGTYRELLVEVKPTKEMAMGAMAKARAAAPSSCILFTEGGLTDRHDVSESTPICDAIGWVVSPFHDSRGRQFQPMRVMDIEGVNDAHIDGDRYVGFYSGKNFWENEAVDPFMDYRPVWATASNTTRWNAK